MKIDVNKGILTIEFEREIIYFNIFDAIKYPSKTNSDFVVSVIDHVVQEVFELDGKDALEVVLTKHLELENNL